MIRFGCIALALAAWIAMGGQTGATGPTVAIELGGANPSTDALVVTKFWYPWRYTSLKPAYYYGGIVAGDGRNVWDNIIRPPSEKALVRIDLDDFSSSVFLDPSPEGSNAFSYCAMPDTLYGVGEADGHDGSGGPLAHIIARLDSTMGTWTTHAIPDCFNAKVYGAGNDLFLFLNSRAAKNEDVIDRYDWATDRVTVLASTRRRPAQNQFDNRERLLYAQIYAGPGHRPCLTTADGTFFIRSDPGPWPEVFDSVQSAYATPMGGETLVVGGDDEVVLLNPDAPAAVPLMTADEPYFRKPPAPGAQPTKDFPSWVRQARWTAPAGAKFNYTNVAYHHGSLYILREPEVKEGDYTLLCYQEQHGPNARMIGVRLRLDARASSDLMIQPIGSPKLWVPAQIEHPDINKYPGPEVHLFCTDSGICIEPEDLGFWYLPYADIEAYLARLGPQSQ